MERSVEFKPPAIPESIISSGPSLTINEILRSLIAERVISIENTAEKNGVVTFRGKAPTGLSISGAFLKDPFTGEPHKVLYAEINNGPISDIAALEQLGLSPEQLETLLANAQIAGIIKYLKHYVSTSPEVQQIENLWNHITQMSFTEAFVFSEQALNTDGPHLNPLRYTMKGEEVINYHPNVVYLRGGTIEVPVIEAPGEVIHIGNSNFDEFIPQSGYPIHPYNAREETSKGRTKAHPLMSKRSLLLPEEIMGEGAQIKFSVEFQISSRVRRIAWEEAINAIENTKVVRALAEKGLLPDNLWFVPDIAAYMIKNRPDSVFIVRAGWNDYISNNRKQLPLEDTIPVAMCSLWSESLFGRSLLEDVLAKGIDVERMITQLVEEILFFSLKLIDLGFIPEAHSQNLIVLLNRKTGMPEGFILRDNEGAKVDVAKIKSLGIAYKGVYKPEHHATSPLAESLSEEGKQKIISRYFNHCIIDSNIRPLLLFLVNHLGWTVEDARGLVREKFNSIIKEKPHLAFLRNHFYRRNLARVGLRLGGDSYRTISPHPFL